MASKATDKRPSKLLNLNNSSKANKLIFATNAKRSPLLLLPPELRCRIYDYVFGSYTIHVSALPSRRGKRYLLCTCQHPHEFDNTSPRLAIHEALEPSYDNPGMTPHYMEPHGECIVGNLQKCSAEGLSLDVLRSCRQIYHEAVLKPFYQISFVCIAEQFWGLVENTFGLRAFLDALVPTQARAVANLRLAMVSYSHLNHNTFARLGGLEQLHVEISTYFKVSTKHHQVIPELRRYCAQLWIKEIGKLHLKTLRISCDVECRDGTPTKAEEESIKNWLESTETKLLQQAEGQ